MEFSHRTVPIVPCSDLDESQDFYGRLGFELTSSYEAHGYRILHDSRGASLHLTKVDAGWVVPERNAHGIYLYSAEVDSLAEACGCRAQAKPWGLKEFAVSDPDGTLVRVGWPG